VPKRIVWVMLKKKKKEKKKISMPKGMREEKKCMPKSMKKRKKREKNKDSSYIQIKALIQIERDS
jgi:hypothetical protein